MPRRHRYRAPRARTGPAPAPAEAPPLLGGWVREEEAADGRWVVRSVSGSAAGKPYRCPGCDQEIAPGTPHVVAWPAPEPGEEPDGPEGALGALGVGAWGDGSVERRHWHTDCWRRRR